MGCVFSSKEKVEQVFIRPTTARIAIQRLKRNSDHQDSPFDDLTYVAMTVENVRMLRLAQRDRQIFFPFDGIKSSKFIPKGVEESNKFSAIVNACVIGAERIDLIAKLNIGSIPVEDVSSGCLPLGGKYIFRFLQTNGWQSVEIDDKIPCSSPSVTRFSDCSEGVWLPLLEKAYSKLFGSYEKMFEDQDQVEALTALFGIKPACHKTDSTDPEVVWEGLHKEVKKGDTVLGVTIQEPSSDDKDKDGNPLPSPQAAGLEKNGMYAIVDTLEKGDIKLVCLRNHWGTNWKGEWGPNSPLWNSPEGIEVKAMLPDHESSFWLPHHLLWAYADTFYEIEVPTYVTPSDAIILSRKLELADAVPMVVPSPEFPTLQDAIDSAKKIPDDKKVSISIRSKCECANPLDIDRDNLYIVSKKKEIIMTPGVKITGQKCGIENIKFLPSPSVNFTLSIENSCSVIKRVELPGTLTIDRSFYGQMPPSNAPIDPLPEIDFEKKETAEHDNPGGNNNFLTSDPNSESSGGSVIIPGSTPESKDNAPVLIEDCTFFGDKALGIEVKASDPTISNCRFSGLNVAILFSLDSAGIVQNCTFSGNKCGIKTEKSNPSVQNCTFQENSGSSLHIVNAGGRYYKNTFTRCTNADSAAAVVTIAQDSNPRLEQIQFNQCGRCILVSSSQGTFMDCDSNKSTEATFLITSHSRCIIKEGCSIVDGLKEGVIVESSEVIFEANEILRHKNAPSMICSKDSRACITGNTFSRNTGHVMVLEECQCKLSGNNFNQNSKLPLVIVNKNTELELTHNNFSQNDHMCLFLNGVKKGTFEFNVFTKTSKAAAVTIQSQSDVEFSRNKFIGNNAESLLISDSHGVFQENGFIDNKKQAITIQGECDFTFSDNFINNNFSGLLVVCGEGNIENNEFISNSGIAVSVEADAEVNINGNNFQKNNFCLNVIDGNGDIKNNTFSQTKKTICTILGEQSSAHIEDNEFVNNPHSDGIHVTEGAHPFILRNKFQNNASAFIFSKSAKGMIEENDVSGSTKSCAIVISESSPTLKKNKFHNNSGPTVLEFDNASGVIEDNDLEQNKSVAIQLTKKANPEFKMNRIKNNSSAISVDHSKGSFFGEIISNHTTGTVISITGDSSPTFEDLQVSENTGGDYVIDCLGSSKPVFKKSEIFQNSAVAVHCSNASISFDDCKFTSNGGGMIFEKECKAQVNNCEISDHSLQPGIYVKGPKAAPTVTKCTISKNATGIIISAAGGTYQGNQITSNLGSGLEIVDAAFPVVSKNVVKNNNGPAISLRRVALIYDNDISGNDGGDYEFEEEDTVSKHESIASVTVE